MEILNDFNTSVKKALEEIDPKYMDYPGFVICGTHAPHDVEKLIDTIREVRISKTPFLGICAGHQFAAIEYARNVIGDKSATSEEFYQSQYSNSDGREFIVKKLPELKVGLHDGESYWNNYEVKEGFESIWKKEDNFITCQFHPEYQSSKDNPHPLLVKFLEHARMAM